jgi:hypothetical protein
VWNYQSGPTIYWGCGNTPPPANNTAGYYFTPHESDYSVLNPGDNWFWDGSDPVTTPQDLWEHYTMAFNTGSQMILNVPPDRTGSIPANITSVVAGFGNMINKTYVPVALAPNLPLSAPCSELIVEMSLPAGADWDQVLIKEDLSPQLISSYILQYLDSTSGQWVTMSSDEDGIHGGTVGARVNDYGLAAYSGTTDAIRFVCTSVIDDSMNATITHFGAYLGCWPC